MRLTVEMAMMGGAAAMIGDLNCIWIMSVVDERERERETSPLSSVLPPRGIGGTFERCRVTLTRLRDVLRLQGRHRLYLYPSDEKTTRMHILSRRCDSEHLGRLLLMRPSLNLIFLWFHLCENKAAILEQSLWPNEMRHACKC